MMRRSVVLGFACIFFCCSFYSVKADYNDVRCKCICPSKTVVNEEENDRRVYISRMDDPQQCTCQNVVNPINEKDFCPRCECKWQRRNTTTIKVVVIIIVCIVSLLFLYMLFLLCLDPLMSRRPRTYQEQHNEEVNLVAFEVPVDDHGIGRGVLDAESPSTSHDTRSRSGSIINRVKGQVSKVRGEQQKWKGTVMEQRKNIFDRRTMLN